WALAQPLAGRVPPRDAPVPRAALRRMGPAGSARAEPRLVPARAAAGEGDRAPAATRRRPLAEAGRTRGQRDTQLDRPVPRLAAAAPRLPAADALPGGRPQRGLGPLRGAALRDRRVHGQLPDVRWR